MHKLSLLTAALCAASASAAPINDAISAYHIYDVNRAERLYRQVADDAAALPRDRARARTELARIEWLVDGDATAALARLGSSLSADPEPCAGALLYARILNAADRATDVPRLTGPYAAACVELRPNLIVEIARSHVLRAAGLPMGRRGAALRDARDALAAMPPLVRASLGAARLELDVGILAGDGLEALRGWRGYLWLGARNRPLGSPFEDAAIATAFRSGVRPGAAADATLALGEVLTRTGFAEELAWVGADQRLERSTDPRAVRQSAYLAMRARLVDIVLAHDRAYARGHREDADAYDRQLLAILADGARAAGATVGDDPWPALSRLWGISGQSGVINGVGSVMLGHAVEERDRAVRQNGREARIRLVMLDNMVENSFSAWLWDSGGGPGGWAGPSLIYQIRPGYAGGTLTAMAVATPGPARDQAIADAERQTVADGSRMRGSEPVALPGLGARLRLQAIDEVAAEARRSTRDLSAFLAAFRTAWWDAEIEASIILHEGRHVLDKAEYTGACALPEAELEYRAKLVEVGLSEHPRLRLSDVLGDDMSAGSTHGQANRRIAALYRGWMEAHHDQVGGYDPSKSSALQIDKLTNAQMKSIANAADPEGARPASCVAAPA